jgi:hypothetical protein
VPANRRKTAQPKRPGRKPILKPELVAAALVELKGNISRVASRFNVARQSVQQIIEKNKNLRRVLTDCRESRLDAAEESLGDAVGERQGWAVCFTLKTIGRSRGYDERPARESAAAEVVDAFLAGLARAGGAEK